MPETRNQDEPVETAASRESADTIPLGQQAAESTANQHAEDDTSATLQSERIVGPSPTDWSITLEAATTSLVVSPPNLLDGASPAQTASNSNASPPVLSSPSVPNFSPHTLLSETYARLDQVDLLSHQPLIHHGELEYILQYQSSTVLH